MKTRQHHNYKGLRQIKGDKTSAEVEAMARRLGLPFVVGVRPGNRLINKKLMENRHGRMGQ
jgi:hypothetical protein